MRRPIEWQLLLLSVFSGLLYIVMLIFKMKFPVSPLIQVLGTLNNYYSAYRKHLLWGVLFLVVRVFHVGERR